MGKITINNKEYEFEGGMSLIQVCDQNNIEIPRFCYHDKLKIAGNCRMCLVEVDKVHKPVASCALEAKDGMVVSTKSQMVKDAREGVMEFLLINHPLDCPICDQGGECDLQDQAMLYGKGCSRFEENKRSVEDKSFGPLIKTHMTRCIHCTRCVRFSEDVAGVEEIGTIGRGENMEITTYLDNIVTSELSGNVIDLCPVGALTSKPYAFKARSWELKKTYSIDVSDAVGSNIRIDSRASEVMRVLPRLNDEINEEWISDKARFSYDGLKNQRITKAYIRQAGKLIKVTWEEAIKEASNLIASSKPDEVAAIAGGLTDCETMYSAKNLLNAIGSNKMDVVNGDVEFDQKNRSSYLFNTSILGIEQSDLCLMIGVSPRYESAILNARIRKRSLEGKYPVYTIGCDDNINYKFNDLGDSSKIIEDILKGKHKICKTLEKAKKPMMIIGYGAIQNKSGKNTLATLSEIAEKYSFVNDGWNGFNILHRDAAAVGALELGFKSSSRSGDIDNILASYKRGLISTLLVFGCDEIDANKLKTKDSKLIYFGHHGDVAANYADIIIPAPAFTEKDGTFINLEGRVQRAYQAISPFGDAQPEWKAILDIASCCNIPLEYSDLDSLREKMSEEVSIFKNLDELPKVKWKKISAKGSIESYEIKPKEINFYMTNSICRSSRTMAKCVKQIGNKK
ncbi:MAG: NADH-quinone oxidoreductase subunit NuoG [Rickettsiales bacterium]